MNVTYASSTPLSSVWWTSEAFSTGCVAVVLTLLVSAACYQARSRRRLMQREALVGASL